MKSRKQIKQAIMNTSVTFATIAYCLASTFAGSGGKAFTTCSAKTYIVQRPLNTNATMPLVRSFVMASELSISTFDTTPTA